MKKAAPKPLFSTPILQKKSKKGKKPSKLPKNDQKTIKTVQNCPKNRNFRQKNRRLAPSGASGNALAQQNRNFVERPPLVIYILFSFI